MFSRWLTWHLKTICVIRPVSLKEEIMRMLVTGSIGHHSVSCSHLIHVEGTRACRQPLAVTVPRRGYN